MRRDDGAGRPGQGRTALELVRSGDVTEAEAYYAAVVLERLQDRGTAHDLTLEEMCEVLGYCGENHRPADVGTRSRRA
jgi:hypothetical protein